MWGWAILRANPAALSLFGSQQQSQRPVISNSEEEGNEENIPPVARKPARLTLTAQLIEKDGVISDLETECAKLEGDIHQLRQQLATACSCCEKASAIGSLNLAPGDPSEDPDAMVVEEYGHSAADNAEWEDEP
ncbi:hypothetical protein C8J56DRAFT_888258 [Mycena floridula]|nr:hypothetical protein C8J56DRAFT_888258 [Mycena floridula]